MWEEDAELARKMEIQDIQCMYNHPDVMMVIVGKPEQNAP